MAANRSEHRTVSERRRLSPNDSYVELWNSLCTEVLHRRNRAAGVFVQVRRTGAPRRIGTGKEDDLRHIAWGRLLQRTTPALRLRRELLAHHIRILRNHRHPLLQSPANGCFNGSTQCQLQDGAQRGSGLCGGQQLGSRSWRAMDRGAESIAAWTIAGGSSTKVNRCGWYPTWKLLLSALAGCLTMTMAAALQ